MGAKAPKLQLLGARHGTVDKKTLKKSRQKQFMVVKNLVIKPQPKGEALLIETYKKLLQTATPSDTPIVWEKEKVLGHDLFIGYIDCSRCRCSAPG
ncbi:unnamed protein product [Arabidopsis thaliana]|uniref:(thale cress) hypothetical protein n=1 Tax=Arabidopsis thaliana TaxID=3702 RepID=A0A7G2DV91_ARATH|nr:unnamed protein product [Arabidopsis thaliana]